MRRPADAPAEFHSVLHSGRPRRADPLPDEELQHCFIFAGTKCDHPPTPITSMQQSLLVEEEYRDENKRRGARTESR
jgi:hypothetical protein